jgi:hypothetical protein
MKSAKVGGLSSGQIVKVISEQGEWKEVEAP